MAIQLRIETTLATASSFIAPVVNRASINDHRECSIISSLAQGLPNSEREKVPSRNSVIRATLGLLLELHELLKQATSGENYTAANISSDYLFQPKARKTINGLLDLISLEGIYPSLSPGVGIPLEQRVRSVLSGGVVSKPNGHSDNQENDIDFLQFIVAELSRIALDTRQGLEPMFRDRTLVDLICATGELAFNPSLNINQGKYRGIFKSLLDITPAATLLPLISSILLPSTPGWLRFQLSVPLSLIPLRPGGLRQTIEFIASTTPAPSSTEEAKELHSPNLSFPQGPLSFEALTHASRLLGSPPSTLSPENYFTQLAPQLLELLDGKGGPELAKASGIIVGAGILAKKAFGAPGEIGWSLFAAPILNAINPTKVSLKLKPAPPDAGFLEVSEASLETALKRLLTIVSSHPNPGLSFRLISPLVMPLWALLCIAAEGGRLTHYQIVSSLLQNYFKLSNNISKLFSISQQILLEGSSFQPEGMPWKYVLGPANGVEIRGLLKETPNLMEIIERIDFRVKEFVSLVDTCLVEDSQIGDLFLRLTKAWLLDSSKKQDAEFISKVSDGLRQDPLTSLANAKLVDKMMSYFEGRLSSRQTQLFELIKQLLEEYIEQEKVEEKSKLNTLSDPVGPSLKGLKNIVDKSKTNDSFIDEPQSASTNDNAVEIVSIAFSLLNTILSSPEFTYTKQDAVILMSLEPSLKYLSSSKIRDISSSIPALSVSLSQLLGIQLSLPKDLKPEVEKAIAEDYKARGMALSYLADSQIPVRAQGISILRNLISKKSPILDIPAIAVLLMSLLQDQEEFIYINAIKTLILLSERHSSLVLKMMVEGYVDRNEENALDARLRIGEGLLGIAERLGELFVGDAAKVLGGGMIEVAGRRGRKPKAQATRNRKIENVEKTLQEGKDAWGGEIPRLGEDEPDDDAVSNRNKEILTGWEGKLDGDDIRIRASALSILGAAIEGNVSGLRSSISEAIDLALSVLVTETGIEAAILRRAAVLLIMSLIRAFDKAQTEGRKLGFGFAEENLTDVIQVIKYIQVSDNDELTREHAAAVAEGLETWQAKNLLGIQELSLAEQISPRVDLDRGRLVGLALNAADNSRLRPAIEEIE